MWILTPFGFFSVVQKSFEPHGLLTIRARSRGDLENLRDQYLGNKMGQITEDFRADYQFRATVINKDWAEAVGQMTMDIDYDNFKNEVKARQGSERAAIYGHVWSDLYEIQRPPRSPQPEQLTGFDVAFAPELAGIEQTDECRSDAEPAKAGPLMETGIKDLVCDYCGVGEVDPRNPDNVSSWDYYNPETGETDSEPTLVCDDCRLIPSQDRTRMP